MFKNNRVAWLGQAMQLDHLKGQSLNFAWPQCINNLLK